MSDKTQQDFEDWAKAKGMNVVTHSDGEKYAFNQRCFEAWQHQQAIIDARDAELSALRESFDIQKETLSHVMANFLATKVKLQERDSEIAKLRETIEKMGRENTRLFCKILAKDKP